MKINEIYKDDDVLMRNKENMFEVNRVTFSDGTKGVQIVMRVTNGPMKDSKFVMDMNLVTAKKLIKYLAEGTIIPLSEYNDMYCEFERKYNPYPVQMSREEAFRHALNDGLIDDEVYDRARAYYKELWNYVGD